MRLIKPIYQASIGVLFLLVLPGLHSLRAESGARYIDPDPKTGTSRAVLVRNTPLAHTSGLMPVNEQGKPAGQGEPAAQVAQVLTRLSSVLATVHSGLDQLVKLNVYAADGAAVSAAQSAIAGRFKGAAKPAVMFVVGDLPNGVSVAMDGIALAPRFRDTTRVSRFHVPALPGPPQAGQVAVLPPGGAYYVSGAAAETRDSVRSATFHTMENLQATSETHRPELGSGGPAAGLRQSGFRTRHGRSHHAFIFQKRHRAPYRGCSLCFSLTGRDRDDRRIAPESGRPECRCNHPAHVPSGSEALSALQQAGLANRQSDSLHRRAAQPSRCGPGGGNPGPLLTAGRPPQKREDRISITSSRRPISRPIKTRAVCSMTSAPNSSTRSVHPLRPSAWSKGWGWKIAALSWT